MSRAPVVFVVGLLLGGAGVSILAHIALDGSPPAAADASLARQLDAIEADLRALHTAIADQPAPLPVRAEAAPAPLANPRLDDVLSQLAALQAALADLGTRVDAVGLAWADEAKRTKASEPLPDALPDSPPNLAAFDAVRKQSDDDVTRDHLLWTYEQVGARFGKPSQIRPSAGGVGIKYIYELPGGDEFYFWFVDGKVIGAFWN